MTVHALRSRIKELERQQANVVRELREYRPVGDEDTDQQWRGQLRDSFAQIATERKRTETQLADLTDQKETVTSLNPALLDRLPIVQADLSRLPEDLERELFRAFQLQVRYHHPTRRVTLRTTLDERALRQLIATTGKIVNQDLPGATQETEAEPPPTTVGGASAGFSLAVSAPGKAPTCARSLLPAGRRLVPPFTPRKPPPSVHHQ